MAGGKQGKTRQRIFTFLIALAFGIISLSITHSEGVSIYIDIEEPDGELHYGMPVKLRCYVSGLDRPYFIQWQCLKDYVEEMDSELIHKLPIWENVGCSDETYEFVLDRENINYAYRVVIMYADRPAIATNTDLLY